MNKTSGEYIKFHKNNPGRIKKDKIVGTAIILSKEIVLERADVKKVSRHSDGSIIEVINKDGKIYQVVGKAREEEDKFIFFTTYRTSESVTIPLSEVKSLQIKKIDRILTFIVVVIPIAALGCGLLYLSLVSTNVNY